MAASVRSTTVFDSRSAGGAGTQSFQITIHEDDEWLALFISDLGETHGNVIINPGGTTDIYQSIDEETADDADYVTTV